MTLSSERSVAPEKSEKFTIAVSVEEKLALLERKFGALEKKYVELTGGMSEREANAATDQASEETDATIKENEPMTDQESLSPKPRVRVVMSRIDPRTGEQKDFDSELAPTGADKTRNVEYVSVLRKTLSSDGRNRGCIELNDEELLALLRKLLRQYPDHCFLGDIVSLRTPYEALIMNWDLLWEESGKEGSDEKEKQARLDLREVLKAILSGSGSSKLDLYLEMRDSLKSQRSITFESLWTIFPPGTIVYGRLFLKYDQVFMVHDNVQLWPRAGWTERSGSPRKWKLKCWIYDYTGRAFSRRVVTLYFGEFEGTKPISSLPYYPLEEHTNRAEVRARLLESGKLFRQYCTAKEEDRIYKYNGEAVFDGKGFRGVKSDITEGDISTSAQSSYSFISSDVMVDFKSYYQYGRHYSQIGTTDVEEGVYDCSCPSCSSNEALRELFKPHYDGMTGGDNEKWEDIQLMLCPPRVLGYILKDKQWAQLAIDKLKMIPEEDPQTVLRMLYLEGEDNGAERKDLLYGLVKNHGAGPPKRIHSGYELNDIVAEKGKGLVILLYGTPGVGKTSTAQMIAIAARKPLFSIGVADVGTSARHVESNLQKIFDLANTWRAILLIDEADVFLQSRSQGTFGPSAEGSALVSVFLRVLEYYHGILFLTTNQIAQFDVAVQSRIHIALKYEGLSKEQTKNIFLEFVDQYRRKGLVDSDRDKITKYAEKELYKKRFDGRQIRNIVSSAMGNARSQRQKMSLEHIQDIVSHVEDFKTDLAGQMMKWQDMQMGTRIRDT